MELNKQDIAGRFAALPLEKRKVFLDALRGQGIDFSLLPIIRQPVASHHLLSYAQQRHWFLWQLNPQSTAYHLGGVLRLNGALNRAAIKKSFSTLIARHESLRTIFRANENGLPEQIIKAGDEFDLIVVDLCDLPVGENTERAHTEAIRIHTTPFDLTQGPLLRVALIQLSPQEYHLVIVMHHIISDAWSNRIIIDEFAACYRTQIEGQESQLPELSIQYADYALWQRNWMEAGEKDRQLQYWRKQLGEDHSALQFPADHARSPSGTYRAAHHDFVLPPALAAQLQCQTQDRGATLFMTLLAGFQILLYRYTGQNDIRVGVPIANRHRVEIENVVGFFVNTQVLRTQIDGRMLLSDIFDQVREAALDAQTYQDLPFEQLVEALQPERSLNQNPLFQIMFNHLREDYQALEHLPGLTVEKYELGEQGAQFELTLDTLERPDGIIEARFTYAAELFEADTIKRLGAHYLHVLEIFSTYSQRCVNDIVLLSAAEREQLKQWGVNERRYDNSEPVHRLIERQAELRPNAVALIFGDTELSYAELNTRANRLAHQLITLGISPESRVGIAVERSVEMVVGLLATLKAGGAYVPLDPDYPRERLNHMVADSAIELLLTQSHIRERIPHPEECQILELDTYDLTNCPSSNPEVVIHGENLAYIIYTSGSTGKPKGAGVAHTPLSMHVQSIGKLYGMTSEDRELQFASINFDGAHERWLVPLVFGAVLMPRDNEIWSADRTVAEITRHGITITCLTPGYLQQLAEFTGSSGRDLPIRSYTVGGEAMSRSSFDFVQETLCPPRIINGYGPTETIITPLIFKAHPDTQIDSGYLPIGSPVGDRAAYIVDAEMNLVPQGVSGELYLGGTGLARGYLNRSSLTAERFVADPFDENGGRLYRTGDLVRWRRDGQIEYLGRLDHQVKVRGFRIELGEIETQLLQQPQIRETVVVAQDGPSGARLVAYVSLYVGNTTDTGELREFLSKTLPDYMIPSAFIVLEDLPLNANSKVDRKRLPEPEFVSIDQYEVPQGEVEEALAVIWTEVLGISRVGRQDNFFELGGDSILSLQIVARLRREGWKISPKQLFERQTIVSLAGVTERLQEIVKVSQAEASGDVPLLPIQAEFFASKIPVRYHWNLAILLQGTTALDAVQLTQALTAVIHHHDVLRMRYVVDSEDQWLQTYGADSGKDVLWVRQAGTTAEIETLCDAAQRSLNLKAGPLIRGVFIKIADGSWRLLLAIHHLVVDGVSWRVLLEDLETAYAQLSAAQPIVLPEKTSAYQEWAQKLQNYASVHSEELAYWQKLADAPVVLPRDWPEPTNTVRHQTSITLSLDRASTEALLKDAPAAYRTQVNDLLLTGLGRALCRWSGHERILIDLEGHGREDLYEDIDLSRTVGWFTSIYPILLDPLGELSEALKRVKEGLRQIPHKGIGYGVFKYLGTSEQRQVLAALPQAQVVFNYLGQLDGSFDKDALWTLADESVGASIDEDAPRGHTLSINGQIYDGELRLDINYSCACYEHATIAKLADSYKAELLDLIAHCVSGAAGVTPSDFPLAGLTQVQLDALSLSPVQLEDLYPLSPMQTGMLFHSLYESGGGVYLNQLCVDIDGLDVFRFHAAWLAVQARHDILRTGFLYQGETLLQWVAREVTLPFIEFDWRDRNDQKTALVELARDDLSQDFDLAQPPLQRLHLIRTGTDRHHFIWTTHHLLLDGWSTSQLLGEILRHYEGEVLPPHSGRYRDYITWIQSWDTQASEVYWREQLYKLDEPTWLAAALPKPEFGTGLGYGEQVCVLDSAAMQLLGDFAKHNRVTLNTLVQAAWALLLQRYTGQTMVTFGATVAGRPSELVGVEQLLGLFINTLPVIVDVRPDQAVGDWLRELQEQNLVLREHEHTPLYEIQRWAGQSGKGLFDNILVFENYPIDDALQVDTPGGLHFSEMQGKDETNYAMTVGVALSDEQSLNLTYNYIRESFSEATVAGIAAHLEMILYEFVRHPSKVVGEIDLLDASEHARLRNWGKNEQRYADTEPVHRLIERQVEQRPDAVAVIFGDSELSYDELNRWANRLAHRLIAQGVGPDVRVGIAIERSMEMIVGLLAILKAGGAYVPLDPAYPPERLEHMVRDSGIASLLTQKSLWGRIPQPEGLAVITLGGVEDGIEETDHNPQVILHGENLAYVIYTSGSTGKPKGVGVSHQGLVEHAKISIDFFGLTHADRVLQFATLNFDGFIEQVYPTLCIGAAIVVRGPTLWDSETFYRELIAKHISVADLTTAYWLLLAQDFAGHGSRNYGALRRVHVGGEAMPPEGINAWRSAGLEKIELFNTYGPTEAVVTATALDCTVYARDGQSLPLQMAIGSPLAGRNIYVMGADFNLVAQGVAGELCIGGALLARGYLNRAELTAERFIADPFDEQGGRLYRTGDLVRWRPDGQIEYLGRLDHQVKIRGFRVELGEIEAQLLKHSEVREAVVVTQEGPSGTRLVGYVSVDAGHMLEDTVLKVRLSEVLPDYMVPGALVVLEALPLNPNGKIDRKALPDPEWLGKEDYEAPQGEVEEVLAAIWTEALSVSQVGRNDNFFELGGDSILSLQIVTKARRAGYQISPRQVFEQQTIVTLAQAAEFVTEQDAEQSQPENACLEDYLDAGVMATLSFGNDAIEDIYPLSPMQEGMLFHTLEAPGTGLYVNQISVEVEGLDAKLLAVAWQRMIVRHAVLRTGFLWQSGLARPLQIVFKQFEAPVIHLDWCGKDHLEEQIVAYADEELKREFDFLSPPVRLSLIRIDENRHQLIWTKHHILLDGWGDSMLISDWLRSYHGEELAQPGPGYGVYARWLEKQSNQASQHFWKAELSDIEGPTLLAESVNRVVEKDNQSDFALIYTHLSVEDTRCLKAFAKQQRVTLNTVVQAAWALLLQRYTGKRTVVFGATVAGRPPSLPRADEILGLFINTIPIPVERHSNLTVGEYLSALQETNVRLRDYEHTSLADIQRWAGSSGQSLFDSIVVFENFPIDAALRDDEYYGLRFGEIAGKGFTGYAMDLQVVVGDTLEIEYAYSCNDFTEAFVIDLRSYMELLLQEMMAHPHRVVGELGWLGKQKLDQLFLLRGCSSSSDVLSQVYQPVHRLIERNAVLQPDSIALLVGDQEMSYAELNIQANKLAHRLIQLGAGVETRIGISMERSLDIIVTLLAILKSGAAYVPLDVEYPADRLMFMVKDSLLSLLVTQSNVLAKFDFDLAVPKLAVDLIEFDNESELNPDIPVHEHNLAYVIYTSGSTGLPKGVAVTHGPLAMHCQATAKIYEMNSNSCELLFMSFSFDGAHERWLTALTVGAGLAVRDQDLWTAEQTYDALHRYGITNAAFPPAYLGQVAEWAVPRDDPPPVELYVFGGEAMPKASYDQIRQTLQPRILINGYGPTETVVTPLIWKTEADKSFDCTYAPIGRPVGERVVYVLDVDMQPVPVGIVGELYIGGYGLARGYLGRPGLTAERFVADLFDENGGRLYRTGDLVRWMEDGNIEYVGRADHQVKIRGFRIELGEIEARIREVAGVADAAVVVHQGAISAQLAAYVVPVTEQLEQDLIAQVKQTLGVQLPEYMLPAYFIPLTILPRLPSGKLDRKLLPQPDTVAVDTYQEPSTPEARVLADIWQEVLDVARVGETDNFFALGGDSLSSLKVMAKIRNMTNVKLDFKLRDLIQRPTIASLLKLDKANAAGVNGLMALNQTSGNSKITPLFCIHAGFGTVFDYQPLARELQGMQTVYGLPCRMLADSTHQDISLDQMAEDYCKLIRSIQPEGPYHILGWSMGGTLAAMMAALLEAVGQDVAFLGLIDPYIPETESSLSNDWRHDFLDFTSVVIPGELPGDIFDTMLSEQSEAAPTKQTVVSLLEKRLAMSDVTLRTSDQAEHQGYADIGAEELAHIFLIARHLKALSLQASALSPLRTQAICWWATARKADDRFALAQQIKQDDIYSKEINADHYDIVRADALLSDIKSQQAENLIVTP